MTQAELHHLYSRASFGLPLNKLPSLKGKSRLEVVNQLFQNSQNSTRFDLDLTDFYNDANQISMRNKKDLVALIKKSKKKFLDLNNQWLDGIMTNPEELRERMTLFWANHFVCKDNNVYHMQLYLNCLKTHALGDFRDFINAVSKQASLLKYLNGKQNRKKSPNENFTRELMELFTLGEGHYTERDIKESARAFTGYNHNFKGDFVFRRFHHDSGRKSFLGQSGYYNGEDIIDIILQEKQCAHYICTKLYTYFVNPVANEAHITQMALRFYKDYDIAQLMHFVFMQDWFYEKENMGAKIKSPVDLLASAHRIVPYEFNDKKTFIKLEKLLGQSLLDPPNVAGWPGDKAWIDTNTLMIRLKLPSLIYGVNLQDGAKAGGLRGRRNPIAAKVDLPSFESQFAKYSSNQISELVIPGPHSSSLETLIDSNSKILTVVRLMSLPEFQMA
ncbi:DUF1800 domain-containing protein [Winogradskyella aurantiaca]|uniref:DUF1800 domain-containing protein n=1 Tax=Winogradskyella aurantiaca TaxID=2219558 RepID=UPI000E1C9305|nr:DUF1800 domain-containing protein [Winogradskyella aurantiaca]